MNDRGELFIEMPTIRVPPDSQVRAGITDVNNWWTRLAESVALTSIRIGRSLVQMQANCKKAGINFGDCFPKNAEDRGPGKLPFSYKTGNKLMSIARNAAMTNVYHDRHCLPADWNSLYELSRVEPKRLTKLIDEGKVQPDMGRPAIKRLVSEAQPAKKKIAKKKVAKRESIADEVDEDRAWENAKRIFTKIKDPKGRAAEFVKLADDCGISFDEIKEVWS